MIKAGALYFAIVVMIIIVTFSGLFLLNSYYSRSLILHEIWVKQAQWDIESAINIVATNKNQYPENRTNELLFNDNLDTVRVVWRKWGMFDCIKSEICKKNKNLGKICLVGSKMNYDSLPAIYLANNGSYLSVVGKTRIKGNCYLPEYGIKQSSIEGKGYDNDTVIWGKVLKSTKNLPPLTIQLEEYCNPVRFETDHSEDSTVLVSGILPGTFIKNSFFNKTLLLYSSASLNISNAIIKGNVIVAAKEVVIDNSAIIDGIIVYAKSVKIGDNFVGAMQIFAKDSINIGNNCEFKYPSIIALYNNDTIAENPYIRVGSPFSLLGSVLFKSNKKEDKLMLGKDSRIEGLIYCTGMLQFNGTLKGCIYTNSFFEETYRGRYENFLLDAKIMPSAMSDYYILPRLFENTGTEIVKILK